MAFPTLTLTREDELRLAAVAETVVKTTVNDYNEHLTVRNSVVDERRWKKIKHRDDMCVYRERSPCLDGIATGCSRGDFHSSNASSSYSSSETDGENAEDVKTMASMLAFGSVEGSLDDIMYGAISPGVEDMQLKTAYTEDGFVDWELVTQILTPSEGDPFRELSVKRLVKGHSLLVGAVMRPRSALFIESNGIAQTPNGERIGYHLRHSVEVPGVHDQPGVSVVLSKISFCFLFRQRRADCVEAFMTGVIDPMGEAPASLIAFTIADVCLAISRNTHCAEMKKLTRILTCQPAAGCAVTTGSASGGTSNSSGGADGGDDNGPVPTKSASRKASCAQCNKSISTKLQLLRSSSKEKHCAMCGSRLCSSCRVHKTMFAPSVTKEKQLTQITRVFCTSCLAGVVNAWSASFASLDARAARGKDVDYASALNVRRSEARRMRKIPE